MSAGGGAIWLASYPKSGSTWLRAMLTALLDPGHATPDLDALVGASDITSRQALDDWCGIDSALFAHDELLDCLRLHNARIASSTPAPALLKTHESFGRTRDGLPIHPPEVTRGAIYVVRDPRAVAVSFAHHSSMTVDANIARMSIPTAYLNVWKLGTGPSLPVHLGSWSEHVRGWRDQGEFPVLLLRYEDMTANPAEALSKVAEFAGIDASDSDISASAHACGFDRLRRAEETQGFFEKPPGMNRFFRSGRAEGWRAELSSAQEARVVADHGEVMAELGYLS